MQPIETYRCAKLPAAPGGVGAEGTANRDRERFVTDVLDTQPVVRDTSARIAAALDQQRVGAAISHGLNLNVVTGQVVRAPYRTAEGVNKAPELRVHRAGDIEVQAFSGRRIKLVGNGLVGRLQLPGNGGIQWERYCRREIEQAEAVLAGGVTLTVDPERVVTRR